MDEKLKRIASVLVSLSDEHRLALVAELVPDTHAVVMKRCHHDVAAVFRDTALRIHAALKVDLKFDPRAIPPAWMAMIETACVRPKPLR
jgi:hypothetical protein